MADAIDDGSFLRSGDSAALIASAYPNCGMTVHEIATEITRAVSKSAIAIEMSAPPDETLPTTGTDT